MTADIYGEKGSEKSITAIAAKNLRKQNQSEKLLVVSSKSRLLHRLKSQMKSNSSDNIDDSADTVTGNKYHQGDETNTELHNITDDVEAVNIMQKQSEYVSDFVWRKAVFD